MKLGPRILFFDTENAPNIAATWGVCDQNIRYSDLAYEWFFISGQWAWDDSKQINTVSLLDNDKLFKKDFRNDYHVVKTLRDVISEADIVVGHNIVGHDLKKLSAKIIEHGLKPLVMPQIVDTYTWSKRHGFTSRSLKNLCKKLKLTQKLDHEPGLFLLAAMGDREAIKKIVKYGKGDIPTVRDLYYRLRPYADKHPNMNLYRGAGINCCPNCGSTEYKENGHRYSLTTKMKRYKCNSCGKGFSDGKSVKRVIMR